VTTTVSSPLSARSETAFSLSCAIAGLIPTSGTATTRARKSAAPDSPCVRRKPARIDATIFDSAAHGVRPPTSIRFLSSIRSLLFIYVGTASGIHLLRRPVSCWLYFKY
jgi:hypothetical protein